MRRFDALIVAGLAVVQGCTEADYGQAGHAWIGRSIDEAIIRWGEPSGRLPLETSAGEVFVFTRSALHPATDITQLCSKWGVSDEISPLLCSSPERTESCKIHAVVQPRGLIARVQVVEGSTAPFGLCQQMLTAPA